MQTPFEAEERTELCYFTGKGVLCFRVEIAIESVKSALVLLKNTSDFFLGMIKRATSLKESYTEIRVENAKR